MTPGRRWMAGKNKKHDVRDRPAAAIPATVFGPARPLYKAVIMVSETTQAVSEKSIIPDLESISMNNPRFIRSASRSLKAKSGFLSLSMARKPPFREAGDDGRYCGALTSNGAPQIA